MGADNTLHDEYGQSELSWPLQKSVAEHQITVQQENSAGLEPVSCNTILNLIVNGLNWKGSHQKE